MSTFMDPDALVGIVEDAAGRAAARGADEAEAFVRESRRLRVSRHGQVVEPTESHSLGIGMRVVIDGAIGAASSAGLHRIDAVIEQALDAARKAAAHKGFEGLPRPQQNALPPTPVPDAFLHPEPETLHQATETAAAALDDERTDFYALSLSVAGSRFAVANTHGLHAWDQGGRSHFDLELRATAGDARVTGWAHLSRTTPFDPDAHLATATQDTQRRAVGALGAKRLDRAPTEAVMAPAPTAQLLTWVLRMFNGQQVADGTSPLADRLGQQVASPMVHIRDVPQDPARGIQRVRIDAEGIQARPLTLLEGGVATETFDDTLSGIGRGGSNGHGNRKGWSGHVAPGLMMPEMRPGPHTMQRLIEESTYAILIEEPLTGMLTTNQRTGDFSAVLPYAYLIESGEITRPIPNVTVSGNVIRLAAAIESVGDTAEETPQGLFPAIRTGGISCAT